MASWQLELQPPPRKRTALELWLQHAAGRILVEDVRAYAIAKIEPGLPRKARAAAGDFSTGGCSTWNLVSWTTGAAITRR